MESARAPAAHPHAAARSEAVARSEHVCIGIQCISALRRQWPAPDMQSNGAWQRRTVRRCDSLALPRCQFALPPRLKACQGLLGHQSCLWMSLVVSMSSCGQRHGCLHKRVSSLDQLGHAPQRHFTFHVLWALLRYALTPVPAGLLVFVDMRQGGRPAFARLS